MGTERRRVAPEPPFGHSATSAEHQQHEGGDTTPSCRRRRGRSPSAALVGVQSRDPRDRVVVGAQHGKRTVLASASARPLPCSCNIRPRDALACQLQAAASWSAEHALMTFAGLALAAQKSVDPLSRL